MECLICYDSSLQAFACSSCHGCFCLGCGEKYINIQGEDVVCPVQTCKQLWTDDYLEDIFDANKMRARRERIWGDKQRSRLPALQADARRLQIVSQEITGVTVSYKKNLLKKIEYNYGKPYHPVLLSADEIAYGTDIFGEGWLVGQVTEQQFVRRCAQKGCRGFLDLAGKCALCGGMTCRDCWVGLASVGSHVCCASDLLIAAETKPCPTCQVPIYRIDGCYQMWCTQCRTAFSWTTGQVEVGMIHNPHYLEWQRRQGSSQQKEVVVGCSDDPLVRACAAWRAPANQHERMLHVANIYYLNDWYSEEEWRERIYLEMRNYQFERGCEEIHRLYAECGPSPGLLAFCRVALARLSARFGFPLTGLPLAS